MQDCLPKINSDFARYNLLDYFEKMKKQLEEAGKGISTDIGNWDPLYIDMFFEVINNKRIFEGASPAANTKAYTREEVDYAYKITLREKVIYDYSHFYYQFQYFMMNSDRKM